MFPVRLIVVGKTSFSFLKEGEAEFEKRIKGFFKFSVSVVKEFKGTSEVKKQKGAEEIMAGILPGSALILLDEKGKGFNSREFASWIEKQQLLFPKGLTFVIGGAEGFSDSLRQTATAMISLSAMTFSHQLIRIIFMEQLYRAATIMHGHPYHND